jgi:hypothetical protein
MTLDQLLAARDKLLGQMTGPVVVETPQLGRVEFRQGDDAARALALIDQEIAELSGAGGGVQVQTIVSSRGLG